MFASSLNPYWRKAIIDELLVTLSTRPTGALITTGMVHLLQATVALTPLTPIATLVASEANFTGYAPIALPALSVPVNLLALVDGVLADVDFIATGPFIAPNNIFGYWVDQNTGADWVLAELFPALIPIAAVGDFLELKIAFPLPLQQQAQ